MYSTFSKKCFVVQKYMMMTVMMIVFSVISV